MKVVMQNKKDFVVLEDEDFKSNSLLGLLYFVFGDKIAPYAGLLK